jgi:hypothetical protein
MTKTNINQKQEKQINNLERRIEVLEKRQCGCNHIPYPYYDPQPTYYPSFPRCSRCGGKLTTVAHTC